jgi:hypothetical protein
MRSAFEHDIDVMRRIDGTALSFADPEDAARPPAGHRVISSVGLWYEFDGEKYVPVPVKPW